MLELRIPWPLKIKRVCSLLLFIFLSDLLPRYSLSYRTSCGKGWNIKAAKRFFGTSSICFPFLFPIYFRLSVPGSPRNLLTFQTTTPIILLLNPPIRLLPLHLNLLLLLFFPWTHSYFPLSMYSITLCSFSSTASFSF